MSINNKGGNLMALAVLNTNYTLPTLTANTNCFKFGNIASSSITTDINTEQFKSEDGIVRGESNDRSVKGEAILMERDRQTLINFYYNIDEQRMLEYKYAGVVGGKHQEFFRIVKGKGQINLNFPGAANSNKYEAVSLAPETSVTFTAGDLSAIETALSISIQATAVTISANTEFAIVETNV
jgi:hypothetical protein